jgi:hypothetical protein
MGETSSSMDSFGACDRSHFPFCALPAGEESGRPRGASPCLTACPTWSSAPRGQGRGGETPLPPQGEASGSSRRIPLKLCVLIENSMLPTGNRGTVCTQRKYYYSDMWFLCGCVLPFNVIDRQAGQGCRRDINSDSEVSILHLV